MTEIVAIFSHIFPFTCFRPFSLLLLEMLLSNAPELLAIRILVQLLLYMGSRRQCIGTESLCQKITQHDGRACIYHCACTVNDGGIMATVDGDFRIGIVTHIDGLLCLINRCRGLDDTGKAQWHTIGNAAVDAAVVIGVSATFPFSVR